MLYSGELSCPATGLIILPILLQLNTGCFPIQKRPVFSQCLIFFPLNLRILSKDLFPNLKDTYRLYVFQSGQ